MSDQPQQILDQLKKNEVYLQHIATSQAEAVEISKKTLTTERYRVLIMGLKFVFIVLLTLLSIKYLDGFMHSITGSLGGASGNGTSLDLGGATGGGTDLTNQLKNSQELMREIIGR